MPKKRGRPISGDIVDPARERQPEAWRRRQQDRRNRQRLLGTSPAQCTHAQLEQGEQIISLTVIEEEGAAATLLQLRPRTPGLTLPQDANVLQSQHDAVDVDEQATLYQPLSSTETSQARRARPAVGFFQQFTVPKTQSSPQNQSQLSHFFPTLPPTNPLEPQNGSSSAFSNVSILRSEEAIFPTGRNSVVASIDDDLDLTVEYYADLTQRQASNGEDEIERLGNVENVTSISNGVDADARNRTRHHQDAIMFIGSEDLLGQDQLSNGHDSDEESEVNFASERSVSSEGSTDVEKISPMDHMIQKMFEQLQGGFHGCSDDSHDEEHRQHVEDAGDNHHGLGEVFNYLLFPSVLGLQDMISSERLARQPAPTPMQWQAMFCGIPTDGSMSVPMNVCLHKEQTQAVEPDVAFDVDSFLGFATSLALARKGLWYQPSPQMRQNMTSDVHLETRIFQDDEDREQPARSRLAMLRDVPHFLLGRVEGAHDITVFVLFSHMAVLGDKFKSLTKDQLSRWTDQVYLPAIHVFYNAHSVIVIIQVIQASVSSLDD